MPTDSPMQRLGEIDGKPCYWAAPGHFVKPGFYFWDGSRNIHVPLADISRLRKAVEFYAKHEHWMALTDDADSQRKLLIANGDTESTEGWAMAEAALMSREARPEKNED